MELSKAYSDVIYNLWDENNSGGIFTPTYFKEIISKENKKFEGFSANDSKDLILFLYEKLHKELNSKKKKKIIIEKFDSSQTEPEIEYFKCVNEFESKNKSIISDLFYYNQANITKCLDCGKLKYKFLIYNILLFPLEDARLFKLEKDFNFPYIDIYDCFEYYISKQKPKNKEKVYCSNCKKKNRCRYLL